MKKLTKQIILIAITALSFTNISAQFQDTNKATYDFLGELLEASAVVDASAKNANSIARTLIINYLYRRTVNTTDFIAIMQHELSEIEAYNKETYRLAEEAVNISDADLILDKIFNLSDQIEVIQNAIDANSVAFANAVDTNNSSQVYRLYFELYNDISAIETLSNEIKVYTTEEREYLYEFIDFVFDVRIELADRNGNSVPAGTLRGYIAQNLDTNKYFYAGEQTREEDFFSSLPKGTYKFSAYDGYFDGASSKTVTLSEDMVNSEGEITVTLTYWSE